MAQRAMFLSILILPFLIGCGTTQLADSSDDREAKMFKVDSNSASLYVYRNQVFYGICPTEVIIDDNVQGQTGVNHFLRIDLKPGLHILGIQFKKNESCAPAGSTQYTDYVEIRTEPGKIYYAWIETHWAGSPGPPFMTRLVDASAGQDAIKSCRLAKTINP